MPSINRRGAAHTVKDEDLTHTKYDSYNREQLLAAVKGAGCYVKDDKKSVMARKLVEQDRNKQHGARRALQEQKEKEELRREEIANAAQAQRDRRLARAKRHEERGTRYEQGEKVSSDSGDTNEDQDRCGAHKLTVTGGLALSDETWEDSCSEPTIRSGNLPVRPAYRLQLFEWPYSHSPTSSQPSEEDKQHPALLPYAPLKLLTTFTHEKITLPGKNYPAGISPSHVPPLSSLSRTALRHGHLLHQLSRAVIEPASLWASRTRVQGWNGMMYFSLPSQSQYGTNSARLGDVYRRWHGSRDRLLHPTPGANDVEEDRRKRFEQIAALKRKRMADVYEASRWKPTAVGYLPAYLDWEAGGRCEAMLNSEKTLGNLWYIRFTGCDMPHYYFWSEKDPTIPDPGWSVDAFSKIFGKGKMRVKKLTAPPNPPEQQTSSSPLTFKATLTLVEEHLIHQGLSSTLATFRAQALAAGKAKTWTIFSHTLLDLHPSGAVPRAPPVKPTNDFCLAAKMALLLDGQDVAAYTGEEGWTRDDDKFWDVVSDVGCGEMGEGKGRLTDAWGKLSGLPDRADGKSDGRLHALYRRNSFDILPSRISSLGDEDKRVWAWLDSITPTFPPPSTPLSSDMIGVDEPPSPLNLKGPETTSICPFCSHNWSKTPEWEKAAHMLSHSHISSRPRTSTYTKEVSGRGVRCRHSVLSHLTLQTYNRRYGRGRKMVRVDSARNSTGSLAESFIESVRDGVVEPLLLEVQKAQRERSPFSKEKRRLRAMQRLQVGCGEGRGGRGWMLERAQSEVNVEDWDDDMDMDEGGDECDGESVWSGDDLMYLFHNRSSGYLTTQR